MPGEDKPRPAANFSAFLKRPEQAQKPVRQAASFSSFLRKQPGQAEPAAAAATESPTDAEAVTEAGPGPEQKPVTVLYGTEYGFSKEIAEKLLGKLKEGGTLWCAPPPCLTILKFSLWVGPRRSCSQRRQLHGSTVQEVSLTSNKQRPIIARQTMLFIVAADYVGTCFWLITVC